MKELTFSHTQREGDMDKNVPLKLVEDVTVNNNEDHPIVDDFNQAQQVKVSDLYHGSLFTVVPKEFDLKQDITPPDQGFNPRSVVLWDTYDGMFKFKDDIWKKIRVNIPKELLGVKIFKSVGDTYTALLIPAEWIVGEEPYTPRYVE